MAVTFHDLSPARNSVGALINVVCDATDSHVASKSAITPLVREY